MSVLSRHSVRKTILTAVMALSIATLAAAQEAAPATGLGQAWPNATDVSTNVNYHVYRFERDGVRYIQVNDLQGQVRAAVATSQDAMFVLPVGIDAQHVTIVTQPATQDSTQVVYQDSNMAVAAVPQDDGSVSIMAMMAACPDDPAHCTLNRVDQ